MPPGGAASGNGGVDVIEVKGRIDPIEVDFIKRSLTQAEKNNDEVLIIQLNSPGALVEDSELDVLAFRISHASVPVAVWIGPCGSRSSGGANQLVTAAALAGLAPGTHVRTNPDGPTDSPL